MTGTVVQEGGVAAYVERLAVHYSSARADWRTPKELFDVLDREFQFTTDVAASAENALCAHFFDAECDALAQDWSGLRAYCNPPYNRAAEFLRKAAEENARGVLTVILLPGRTDTSYWWKWALRAAEIRFLPGRLKFDGGRNSAPFPSAVLIFDGIERLDRTPDVRWWDWREAAARRRAAAGELPVEAQAVPEAGSEEWTPAEWEAAKVAAEAE